MVWYKALEKEVERSWIHQEGIKTLNKILIQENEKADVILVTDQI